MQQWLAAIFAGLVIGSFRVAAADSAGPSASPQPVAAAQKSLLPGSGGQSEAAVGVRIDCLHQINGGGTQDCLSITGVRYTFLQALSSRVRAMIRFDPMGTIWESRSATPYREGVPLVRDTELRLIDDYALIWSARPNLEIAIENYGGAAVIPSVSGLSLGAAFADAGFNQTALTVTYNLAALRDMRVKFVVGNGEGELVKNLDPQQYFGIEAKASVINGVVLNLGVSFDGNNIGSAAYDWERQRLKDKCGVELAKTASTRGFSTQRVAAGVALDGNLPQARGLKAGLGWQQNVYTELAKGSSSMASAAELAGCPLDVDTVLVESADGQSLNTVQKTTVSLNASYRILDTFFLGADFTTRRIDTGSVSLFQSCNKFEGTTCQGPNERVNHLTQTAYTVGAGLDLAEGLLLTIEYHERSYNKAYTQVYYLNEGGKPGDTLEFFNARLTYNWL